MAKTSGILGVDHVAVFTPRMEEAEGFYRDVFQATLLFRATTHRGTWAAIDAAYTWDEIRARGVRVEASFLRAGGLTIIVSDEASPATRGVLDHVGIGCGDAEVRRVKERVRVLGLKMPEESPGGFKFRDPFGVTWEVSRGMEAAKRPPDLDLGTGRVV